MSFFALRQERLATTLTQLTEQHHAALAALDATQDATQREFLEAEIRKLEVFQAEITWEKAALEEKRKSGDASDRDFEHAALWWFRSVTTPGSILSKVAADPTLRWMEKFTVVADAPSIDEQTELSILTTPRPNADPYPLSLLEQIRASAGSATAYEEFVITAYRVWLETENRPYFYDDVVVTLPVRLETIFKPREDDPDNPYTMYLRVIPDEASIDRFEPLVTPQEHDLLRELWQRAYDLLPDKTLPLHAWLDNRHGPVSAGTEETRIAWHQFCSRVGSGRAAWLVSTFLPRVENGQVHVDIPDDQIVNSQRRYTPNHVGGFPPVIEVYAAFNGGSLEHLQSLAVATADQLDLDVPADAGGIHWTTSWEEAKRVGLGSEIPVRVPPEQITALYVVGVGSEHPAAHFTALANSGELGFLDVGVATNTVDGAPAADLGKDPDLWKSTASSRLYERENGRIWQRFTRAFTGTDAFPMLPGDFGSHAHGSLFVRGLWQALWGHYLKDLWGFGDEVHAVGLWAGENLHPEGPLPPLRVGNQPYGLLPVSSFSRWQINGSEGEPARIERHLHGLLLPLRNKWAEIGNSKPRAVGATARELLDVLGHSALSSQYRYRTEYPAGLITEVYRITHPDIDPQRLQEWFRTQYQTAATILSRFFRIEPDDLTPAYYAAQGDPHRLHLPLIVPTRMPILDWDGASLTYMEFIEAVHWLLTENMLEPDGEQGLMGRYRDRVIFDERRNHAILPDSLLLRLMIYSRWLAAAYVVQADQGDSSPLIEPFFAPFSDWTKIEALVLNFDNGLLNNGHPASELYLRASEALEHLGSLVSDCLTFQQQVAVRDDARPQVAALERALRATLDTAAHRIDPWVTGFAWRRLQHLQAQETTRFRLGVYGWLDGPFRGEPGPTDAGMFHAPSHAQALTGVLLRDRYITAKLEGTAERWEVKLESRLVRLAQELADEVRVGSHLWEILGRRVESVFNSFEETLALRSAYPMRRAPAQHKSVCNGQAALDDLLSSVLAGTPNQAGLEVTEERLSSLRTLQRALETHADLLVAEATHQTLMGRAAVAGAAADAASGLGLPPALDFIQTPHNGLAINTSVIVAIPYVEPPETVDVAMSPGAIAEPSVAVALERLLGTADQWTWASGAETVTLASMDLRPIDTIAFSTDLLQYRAAFALGAAPTEAFEGTGKEKHRLARQLVKSLGKQPALYENIARQETDDVSQVDRAIMDELRSRYDKLRHAGQLAVDALESAATTADRRNAVLAALRWSVAPTLGEAEADALFGATDDVEVLVTLVESVATTLRARLNAPPEMLTGEFVPPSISANPVPATLRQPQQIAAAIAQLIAPQGEFAILSAMHRPTLHAMTQLAADETLSADWLPQVSAVRPSLANLEALLLEAEIMQSFPPLVTASSAPDDHWGTRKVAELMASPNVTRRQVPRFVVAFTIDDAWTAETVAVALVDSWTEAIPVTQRTTTAAFGFNAPASRAPQAILLAVPPQLKQRLDAAALLDILQETRLLMAGRSVQYEDVTDFAALLPFMMFQATGRSGLRLRRDVVWKP